MEEIHDITKAQATRKCLDHLVLYTYMKSLKNYGLHNNHVIVDIANEGSRIIINYSMRSSYLLANQLSRKR